MPASKPISNLHTHLGYWLRTVSNAVSHSFARKVEAEGVTVAEWVFMRALFDVEPTAPCLLTERIGMTKGAISKLADRLVKKGLVERTVNQIDKRSQTLVLTHSGRALVPGLAQLADDNDLVFFGSLSARERDQLQKLLRKIATVHELKNIPVD